MNQIVGWVGPGVSRRREALRIENELRLQAQMAQERAESILTSVNDGLVVLDADWRFTYANAAAERMLSCAATDLIGKTLGDIPRYGWYGPGSQLQPRHEGAHQRRVRKLLRAMEALV